MPVPSVLAGADTSELRKHCNRRMEQLLQQRQPWLDFCLQVAEELMPSRLPYLLDPQNTAAKGGQQNELIMDAAGHLALGTAAAGINSSAIPQNSQWFGLKVRSVFGDDEELRAYLEEGEYRLRDLHNQSNANHILPESQQEWLAFGTAAVMVLEDDEDGFRLDPMSVGEYCIAEDRRGRVDTLYRRLTLTVAQLVEEFGIDRVSATTRTHWDNDGLDIPIPCVQAIEPDRDRLNPHGRNQDLPWRSVYYEETSSEDQVLAVRGYSKFPCLVWRWGKLPGSAYGYGRGHDVLPHLVRLRKMIIRYGQAVAYKSEPPVQIPAGLQQHEVKMLPGGKTAVFGQQPITNLFKVELELRELAEEMERTRQEIRDTLGATLVASLRAISRQMTAREAELRTSQDLVEFLPGLYRLHEELLSPYVEWLWEIATMRGELPEAPEALQQHKAIDIEFTSPLARKQRQAEADGIVRTIAVAGEIAKVRPDVVDNIDVDAAIRRIAEIEGAPVSTLVPIAIVRSIREARDRKQAAEAQAAAAQQGVDIAKGAAEAEALAGKGLQRVA